MELWAGISRTVFLKGETLEMGLEVQMNLAFPRDEMALARPGTVS